MFLFQKLPEDDESRSLNFWKENDYIFESTDTIKTCMYDLYFQLNLLSLQSVVCSQSQRVANDILTRTELKAVDSFGITSIYKLLAFTTICTRYVFL